MRKVVSRLQRRYFEKLRVQISVQRRSHLPVCGSNAEYKTEHHCQYPAALEGNEHEREGVFFIRRRHNKEKKYNIEGLYGVYIIESNLLTSISEGTAHAKLHTAFSWYGN